MKLHPVVATLAFLGLSGVLLFAGNSHAKICKKNARPYSLAVQALRGKTTTDVELTVSAASGWEAPSMAKHVYLRSLSGKHPWHRHFRNAALEQGRVAYSVPEAARGTALRAEVHVRTCTCGRTQVMKANTKVLFRPDLQVVAVNAPVRVHAKETVNVEVEVRELNGDLGATFDGTLVENGKVLDELIEAGITPSGTTSLVYALSFEETGLHQISATVGNAQPGDYDEANNSAAFQIEVVPAIDAVAYTFNYRDQTWNSTLDWTYTDESGRRTSSGSSEAINYGQSMPRELAWPLQNVSFTLWADGASRIAIALSGTTPTAVWEVEGQSAKTSQVYWPEENMWIYITSSTDASGSRSSLQMNRYASESVATSTGYHTSYGYTYDYWNTQDSQKSGVALHARQSLATYATIADADGRTYGGWGFTPAIQHTGKGTSWNQTNESGTRSGTSESDTWSAYGQGTTQPEGTR